MERQTVPIGGSRVSSLARRLRRFWRRAQSAWQFDPAGTVRVPGEYFIKAGYSARPLISYDDQTVDSPLVYQPGVYLAAAELAREAGSSRIIDLGCGNGDKLASIRGSFETIGIDHGINIEHCRNRHPLGSWREHDLESGQPVPLTDEELSGSVVVAADVVEHLLRPERLLSELRRCLDRGAKAVVISTPERDLSHGVEHVGPPVHARHVREWSVHEFACLLAAHHLRPGSLSLTQSVSVRPDRNTILAVVYREAPRR